MISISEYDRVTDVLYPFSGLAYVDPEILKKAADRGTEVHCACDAKIRNLGVIISDEHKGYIDSFSQWISGKKFIKRPERFFCDTYKITGECDAIYENENGLTLVDFKTSTAEGKTWYLQGSAYSYLAKKESLPITKIEFVKLCKKGNEPKVYFYEEDFGMFLKCLEVYRAFFQKKVKKDDFSFIL